MKKFLAMLLALVMALSLVACGEKKDDTQGNGDGDGTAAKVKVGFITLHDENSTYDKNFIDAAKEACANLGLVENEDYFIKTNVGETEQCAEVAADLVDAGCNIIFADSFGHEPYMIEVAKANPEVQFCHSTGTRAHTEGLANYHNAFASIYEGRYLAGIAAGLKLNAMIDAGDIKAVMDGTAIDVDWTGTLATNSVVLTDLNTTVAAEGTAEAIAAATEKLEKGEIHVFDCSTFTVKGETLTSYQADVNADSDNTPDTEVVHDGYFAESEKRSAPYFDLEIDGINRLDVNYGG